MTKKKSTKRALISSLLVLAMCFTMLAGTTFAWFTDEATSGNNQIIAGNLKIGAYYGDGYATSIVGADDLFVTPANQQKGLWEPGHVEIAYLKVVNEGSLALKYKLSVNVVTEVIGKNADNGDIKLSEILDLSVAESDTAITYADRDEALAAITGTSKLSDLFGAQTEYSLAPGEFKYVAVVISMATDVGNEANYRSQAAPSITFAVSVIAKQDTVEYDSFDNQYDANADYPVVVSNPTELVSALADPAVTNVQLSNNVTLTEALDDITTDKSVDLNGNTLTVPNEDSWSEISGDVEFKNGTIEANEYDNGTDTFLHPTSGATLTLDHVTINTTGTAVYPAGDTTEVNIIDSTITGGTYAVSSNANTQGNYGVVINIKNSTLSTTGYNGNDGDAATVMLNVEGTLNIEDSVINGHRQAVIVRAGTANIKNTTINYDGACADVAKYDDLDNKAWGSGNEVYGAAIVVGNRNPNNSYRANAGLTLDTVTINNTSARPDLAVVGNDTYSASVTLVNTTIATQVVGDYATVA